jgi:prepilin signal peptidase PulO-like enzyme (type II secretory pathway)
MAATTTADPMITSGYALASALAGSLLGLAAALLASRLVEPETDRRLPRPHAPLVAAASGAFLAPPAVLLLPAPAWPAAALLLGLLLAIAWLDLAAGVVHAALAAPLALAGIGFAMLAAPHSVSAALAGGALGYLAFRMVEAGFRRLRGQEGLGRGDSWVLGAAGAWVGPGGIGPLVALAALTALLALATLRSGGGSSSGLPHPRGAIPFAPALALAAWLVWLCGGGVATWTL